MDDYVLPDFQMEEVGVEEEEEDISENLNPEGPSFLSAPVRRSGSSKVSTVPSGSGLTFVVDDDAQIEEAEGGGIMEDVPAALYTNQDAKQIVANALKRSSKAYRSSIKGKGKGKSSRKKEESAEEVYDEPNEAKRIEIERNLTAKYLSGEMTFKDFVRHIDPDSDEEYLESDAQEDEDDGDDWTPNKAKIDTRKETSDDDTSQQEDKVEKFVQDLKHTSRQQLGKKRHRLGIAPRRKKLDPALQGLMGEANLRFARGDIETAIRMCMEVIRQEPGVPEPFQTLSTLYEETDEHDKALQFALIAAHLAPQDAEEWTRLADMSLEQNDVQQAIACYKRAIDADVKNYKLHWTRCSLLEQIGEKTKALIGFRRLMNALDESKGTEIIRVAKEMARLYHEKGNLEEAKNVIREAVISNPNFVEMGDINLLLELLLTLKQFKDALVILCEYSSVQFSVPSSGVPEGLQDMSEVDQLAAFSSALLPPDSPLEICAKLCVTLIHLSAKHLTKDVATMILNEDPEEYGDLFLDVAEAHMSMKSFGEALDFLEKLVETHSYGKAEVWLRYGECLFEVGRLEEAESAYNRVIVLAPQHMEARRTLSSILNRLGRPDEALLTLSQDEEAELLNPTLLFEKCQLLHSEGRLDEFIVKTELLLSRHFVHIRNKEEMRAVAGLKGLCKKNKAINEVRQLRQEPVNEIRSGPAFEAADIDITPRKEFELFRSLCEVYYEDKRYADFQRITFSAMGSPVFNKSEEIMRECDFLCLVASHLNGDSYHAYNFIRDMVIKDVENHRLWNLFNVVISRADDLRHNRFLMRFMSRKPDSLALGILNGHNCLVAGTYKYSLGEYMSAFKQDRSNPLIALMLGLTFTHMAGQKFSARKHSLVVQACAFLNTYQHLRGYCQESCYNIGRAMHQLGLLPAALHYYKQVLELGPVCGKEGELYDLKKEAAHNIALIYKNSGTKDLARYYLRKYIII